LKTGKGKWTGPEKCLTGIGESQIETFGITTIPVQMDDIDLNLEYCVIANEEMKFDAILGI